MLISIALASLKRRKTSVILTLISIIISVSLLITVEAVRGQIKTSFTRTVSGVDIIVGAPSGQLNLLLSSVFRIGTPTQGIDWSSVAQLAQHPQVSWLIPIALGDAHKGYRVVGTTNAYFNHFQYGNKQPLHFMQGGEFTHRRSAVVGADVARSLHYSVGDNIVISHGLGAVSFRHHDEHPFTISGILEKTGTPVDKAIYTTLAGLEDAHSDSSHQWVGNNAIRPVHDDNHDSISDTSNAVHSHDDHDEDESKLFEHYTPKSVSVVMLGLKNRVAALQLQYQINQNKDAPLMAILPGVALSELWEIMGNIEKLLLGVSMLIMISSLFGLITMLLATMRERKQEISVLRTIGAGPVTLLMLIQLEALFISAAGCVLSLFIVTVLLTASKGWISSNYGVFLSSNVFTTTSFFMLAAVLLATWIISFIPAIAAYRTALHSGLSTT